MNEMMAALLLSNLLERLETSDNRGVTITPKEQAALRVAVEVLGGKSTVDPTPIAPAVQAQQPLTAHALPAEAAPAPGHLSNSEMASAQVQSRSVASASVAPKPAPMLASPAVQLNLDSLKYAQPSVKGAMLCLDFGTAMSKAFVSVGLGKHFELALGTAAGQKGLMLPSTMLIGDDGRLYFGQEALDQSVRLAPGKRKRIDSIKSRLSQRRDLVADVDTTMLSREENPHEAWRFTHGDMIRIFLAYFTDVAERALAMHEGFEGSRSRLVLRRYAHPCWPDQAQATAAESKMREMMEQAQILADTFTGQWAGGISLALVREALDKVRKLDTRPTYLVDCGVPEPVAVAAGAVYESEDERSPYMVVDVGAGTTDFGLFIASRRKDDIRMHQVGKSILGVMQAGDKVDSLLRDFIARREGVDRNDPHGEEVMADLARSIRPLKETLFATGRLDYKLSDGTVGAITKQQFLEDDMVKRFSASMEQAFVTALEAVDDSYLKFLSRDPIKLRVAVTGGSSALDMMQALAHGVVEVRGHKIMRVPVDVCPEWVHAASDDLQRIYPQLAVAIGGSSEDIPQTNVAPAAIAA